MFGETNRCDDDNDDGCGGYNQIIMRPADRIITKSVACSICTPPPCYAIIIYHVILYCSI